MAKKSRKVRSRGTAPIRRAEAAPVVQPVRPVRLPPREAPKAAAVDLRTEYRYVIEDLKRIGVIAVVLLVLLIALALIVG